MPSAFVTGGTGFVGTNLILELLDRGWDVTALHRATSRLDALEGLEIRRVKGDVTDADSVRGGMPEGVDAVFHVAASLNFWSRRNAEQERINVGGTRNVVNVAIEKGARRLVHTSSIAAFGVHDSPIDEETPENASTSWIGYLRTKALAETEVRRGIERGLDATIINPSNILGPYDRTGLAAMIRRIHAGTLRSALPGSGSFCHGREVARVHVEAVEKGGTGENYLLGGADATYLEMARIASVLCGRTPPEKAISATLLRVVARIGVGVAAVSRKHPSITPEMAVLSSSRMLCRSDKAERVLGYRPVPLGTMVEDSHRWLSDNGLLRRRGRGEGQD
jgi:nucleoside-diphosphate-sugar epimerase